MLNRSLSSKISFALIELISLTSCATFRPQAFLGASIGATLGALTGTIVGSNGDHAVRGAFMGAASGAVLGGVAGQLLSSPKATQKSDSGMSGMPNDTPPTLTTPDVKRIWQPDRIEDGKFIKGHFIYVIDKNSRWNLED